MPAGPKQGCVITDRARDGRTCIPAANTRRWGSTSAIVLGLCTSAAQGSLRGGSLASTSVLALLHHRHPSHVPLLHGRVVGSPRSLDAAPPATASDLPLLPRSVGHVYILTRIISRVIWASVASWCCCAALADGMAARWDPDDQETRYCHSLAGIRCFNPPGVHGVEFGGPSPRCSRRPRSSDGKLEPTIVQGPGQGFGPL